MTLAAIRLAILAIILVCMFRPLLVVRAAVPQQNFLGVLLDDSRSMQIADVDGQPRASFVKSEFGASRSRPAEGAVRALHRPHVPVFERGDAHDAGERPDLRRIAVAPRRGAVGRAPGAGRAAGRGPGDGQRRRRHRGCGARRSDPRTQGRGTSGLHHRRRPRDVVERHPGRPRRHAEDRAQGHDADGRRGAVAVGLRRAEGHARRRGRRHAGQHAASVAAGRRHAGVDSGALHRQRSRARACCASASRRSRASSSPRTTRAKR